MLKIKDELLKDKPRYRVRDSNGNIIIDNVTFEMITEVEKEGTPINKKNLEKLQEQKYFLPNVYVRETGGEAHTDNFLKKDNWEVITEKKSYKSDGVQISFPVVDSIDSGTILNVFDENTSTLMGYQSASNTINIDVGKNLKITKFKTYITANSSSYMKSLQILGSYDNENWVSLYYYTGNGQNGMTDIELGNTGYYRYYRFTVTTTGSTRQTHWREIQIGEYYTEEISHEVTFVEDMIPLNEYAQNVIVNIECPEYAEFISFTNPYININSLGNKKINGTLYVGEKYQLIYNGESFDIKEEATTIDRYNTASFSIIPETGENVFYLDNNVREYFAGQRFLVIFPEGTLYDSTKTTYININNLGNKLIDGEIIVGKKYELFYNGESFEKYSIEDEIATIKEAIVALGGSV